MALTPSGKPIEKDPKTDSGIREIMLPSICFDLLARWRK